MFTGDNQTEQTVSNVPGHSERNCKVDALAGQGTTKRFLLDEERIWYALSRLKAAFHGTYI